MCDLVVISRLVAAAPLVSPHTAVETVRLATTSIGALEWLLAFLRSTVNAWFAAESLVASLADVILTLRVRRSFRRVRIVIMLPRVGTVDRHWHRCGGRLR